MGSSTFRLGSFTKSLLAQAQAEESGGVSPGTLQSLVNPMRSQLGLPCLSLFTKMETPSSADPELESSPTSTSVECLRSGGLDSPFLQERVILEDRNDSGVESSSNSNSDSIKIGLPEGGLNILNSSFSATDELNAFKRLAMYDSSDTSSSTTNTIIEGSRTERIDLHQAETCRNPATSSHPHRQALPGPQPYYQQQHQQHQKPLPAAASLNPIRTSVPASVGPMGKGRGQDDHTASSEDRDQSTELPRFAQANLHKGPLSKSSFITPNKTVGIGHGNRLSENNNTFPEVAAVIPTPKPKSKNPSGDNKAAVKRNLATPKANPASSGQLMKQKSLSSLKEKKPGASVGWKFSSEHVQGKEYLIIRQLGKGGCGEVLLVIEKESRELFALKRVNLSGIADASVEECVNEVQMLVDFRDSELVAHIYAWEFDKAEKTMKILMEHGQCDLQHSIKAKNWTSLKVRSIWERLLTIVDLIHKRGIVHADLKPANFIWSGDNLKIIDFGIASRLQSDHTSIAMLCPKGTLNFISPETIQPDSKISPKSDIWSLGCILFLMVYGRTPFEHIGHPVQKMTAIVQGAVDYPPIPPHLSASAPEILSVLKLCFQKDYRRRPSTSDLLQHPLIRNI